MTPMLALVLLTLTAAPEAGTPDPWPPIWMVRLPAGAKALEEPPPATERETVLAGVPFAANSGMLPQQETPRLAEALEAAYTELDAERGPFPTPVFHTLAGQQTPEGFDVLVLPPRKDAHPRAAALFLHGFGGNFTLQCWLFARAASEAGLLTVCPSMAVSGHWAGPEGQRIVKTALDWLGARGKDRVVLAGLSNGGAGASVLARTFERRLVGAIAISGTEGAGPWKLPMLVLHGTADPMASADNARRFAKAGPKRTWVPLPGGHFALLHERNPARDAILRWLRQLLA